MEYLQASARTIDKSKRKGFSSLNPIIFLNRKREYPIASKSYKPTDLKGKFLITTAKAKAYLQIKTKEDSQVHAFLSKKIIDLCTAKHSIE